MYRTLKLQHQYTVTDEEILSFDVDTFLSTLYAIADDYGGQMVGSMFEHITQICEDNGQVINAAGRDFYDVLADVLEKIDIDFDNNGRPKLNLAANPKTAQELSELTPTPEQELRLRQILQRRQEDWLASRHRHELP